MKCDFCDKKAIGYVSMQAAIYCGEHQTKAEEIESLMWAEHDKVQHETMNADHDRIVAELKAELEIQNKANEILTRQTDELRAELTEAKAEVERVKSKDSELIKCLQDLTGANNQVNPHLGVAAGVALMKAELTDSNKTIATQARKLDLARVLYRAAIKIIDRYSTEKFPLTPTIEDVMDRYDKELEAIEQGEEE